MVEHITAVNVSISMAFYWWSEWVSVYTSWRAARIDFYLLLMFHHAQTIHYYWVWCFCFRLCQSLLGNAVLYVCFSITLCLIFLVICFVFLFKRKKCIYKISNGKRAMPKCMCADEESKIAKWINWYWAHSVILSFFRSSFLCHSFESFVCQFWHFWSIMSDERNTSNCCVSVCLHTYILWV